MLNVQYRDIRVGSCRLQDRCRWERKRPEVITCMNMSPKPLRLCITTHAFFDVFLSNFYIEELPCNYVEQVEQACELIGCSLLNLVGGFRSGMRYAELHESRFIVQIRIVRLQGFEIFDL